MVDIFFRAALNKKTVNRFALLFALLVSSGMPLYAQVFKTGETERAGKPYSINVTVREEYDDNIFTSNTNHRSSMKTILRPSFILNYPMDQTLVSARYTFGATFFENRPGDDWDLSHQFLARLAHSFTPQLDIDIRESFRLAQEPEIRESNIVSRREGDYIQNTISGDLRYAWTERFTTVSGYRNTFIEYDDAAAAFANDLVEHTYKQDFRLTVLPTTTAVVAYELDYVDYDKIDRDHLSNIGSIGADHFLNPQWEVSARVGGQHVHYENSLFDDTVVPYGKVATSYKYAPKSNVGFSYEHSETLTDSTIYASTVSHIFGLNNIHFFTPKFSAAQQLRYSMIDYERDQSFAPGTNGDADENLIVYSLNLAYEFDYWLTLEAGYSYTTLDSDFTTREYDRSRFYLGARFTY